VMMSYSKKQWKTDVTSGKLEGPGVKDSSHPA